jgi:hypothetical protein
MDINPNYCKCGYKRKYSEEYDAYYCELCNKWLEDKCDDAGCEFCKDRPKKPNE